MEIDTSSYPKAKAPDNPLDTVAKVQQIQRNNIGIDQEKLKLYNEQYNVVHRGLGNLLAVPEGELTADHFYKFGKSMVESKTMTPEQYAQFVSDPLPTKAGIAAKLGPNANPQEVDKRYDAELRKVAGQHMLQAQATHDAIGYFAGTPSTENNNQQIILGNTGKTTAVPGGLNRREFVPSGNSIPIQPPPTTPYIPERTPQNPNPAPTLYGSRPLANPVIKGGLPIQAGPNMGTAEPKNSGGPVDKGFGAVQSKPLQQPPLQSGYAPGVKEAEDIAGIASGKHLAQEREIAANFQRSTFPLAQAIKSLDALGTKGTGPGTDTINQMKSFILSNVPGVTEANFDGTVKDFDKAKKYLTDFVNQNGNTGTNDKLAAAFAGNPSVSISNAVASDVAKSAYALARMRQAMLNQFEQSGQSPQQFSKWYAKNATLFDPRAFGVDMMSSKAKQQLRNELEKNPKEREKFEASLLAADSMGLVKK